MHSVADNDYDKLNFFPFNNVGMWQVSFQSLLATIRCWWEQMPRIVKGSRTYNDIRQQTVYSMM